MKTELAQLSTKLIGFLTKRDAEKSVVIAAVAVAISGLWLLVAALSPAVPGALAFYAPQALRMINKLLLTSFAGNIFLLALAWHLRDRTAEQGTPMPNLLVLWVGLITVWTAHLLGLMSSVGIAAVPVMATMSAAVYGIRRTAVWSATLLAAVFAVGCAEIYGYLPVAPLSAIPIEHAYRNPAVYLPSFVILCVWTGAGVAITGALVEALKVQSLALADTNVSLSELVALKNRLARSTSTTIRDHLGAAWHLSRSARDILRGMTPAEDSYTSLARREQADGIRWAESSLQLSERSLSASLDELDRLADVAAVEAGHDPLHKIPVAIASLAREIAGSFDSVATIRRVKMSFDASGLMVGRYDLFRIRQVLAQLIGSALGHTPPGGQVAVFARQRSTSLSDGSSGRRWHEIEIAHSGPGFPENLVERYGRGRDDEIPAPPVAPVRSQGLALVTYWVRRHGGRLRIENLIDGCRVIVQIPVEAPRAAIVASSPGRGTTLEQTLRAAGHHAEVVMAEDAGSTNPPGIWMAVMDPDVVIVELSQGPVAAAQLMRSVRARTETAHVPVVALTMDQDEETLALYEGFDDFIRWSHDTGGQLEQRLDLFYQRRTRV